MSKKTPHPGDIYAGLHDNVATLKAAYPHQFTGPSISHDWPDGWHHLVEEACAGLERLDPDSRWVQIKEKFGGLRLYHAGGPLRLDLHTSTSVHCSLVAPGGGPVQPTELLELIFSLEQTSLKTCSLCGGVHGPGREITVGGWMITACETCEPLIRAHRALPYGER
jgi:hypothetical protein